MGLVRERGAPIDRLIVRVVKNREKTNGNKQKQRPQIELRAEKLVKRH